MPETPANTGEDEALPSGPVARNSALAQMLTIVRDLQAQFGDLRSKLENVATRDDLKQFITRDLADSRENAIAERFNAMTSRQQRTEDKLDALRDQWQSRILDEQDTESSHRTTIGFRMNDRLWAILALLLSPLIYTLINYIITHR